ncbi:3-oxoacyl-ACP synthase [Gudongella oleilytica]|jgi:3-oxoacyl-[acyl-carrier-protein] synthase-3|uniref:3-oxoacyl-ACP synthase n=1 Tax=Gudongella oleilytica TaxID=1582259 RepID=UPI002A35C676|nr:3-oxoacyl-ACP synthase [Gudongella oleilytica]MDY0257642.1 3-oxoacyl-ACP synthase [Gudongella oleilytica]
MKDVNIGIDSIGIYVPETVQDYRYIGKETGIPEDVILNKFGIRGRHKALSDESVSDMAEKAALIALNGFDPKEIDLVVYCGSEYKDYYLFNLAAKVQESIGAINANAFEIHSLCSAGVYSLKVLKSMMKEDSSLRNVLLVTSSKETDLVNFKNQRSRFMFNFGDGAAAVLLKRGLNRNIILQTHMITDGRFAEDVACYNVGCKAFGDDNGGKFVEIMLDVKDPESMKERLDPVSLSNFHKAIENSLKKSGYSKNQADFIAPIFMKKSMLDEILKEYGLTEENSFILKDYGHCQSADAFISLVEGMKMGRLKDGDVAVLLGAGTGYTWAATTILWGEIN